MGAAELRDGGALPRAGADADAGVVGGRASDEYGDGVFGVGAKHGRDFGGAEGGDYGGVSAEEESGLMCLLRIRNGCGMVMEDGEDWKRVLIDSNDSTIQSMDNDNGVHTMNNDNGVHTMNNDNGVHTMIIQQTTNDNNTTNTISNNNKHPTH